MHFKREANGSMWKRGGSHNSVDSRELISRVKTSLLMSFRSSSCIYIHCTINGQTFLGLNMIVVKISFTILYFMYFFF